MEIIHKYRKSINPPYSRRDFPVIAGTLLLLFIATAFIINLPNSFKAEQTKQSKAEAPIPLPQDIGYRLTYTYKAETGELILKDKKLVGVLPQPPQLPSSEIEYFNFKVSLSVGNKKNYENWVTFKKDGVRYIDPNRKDFEFSVDVPTRVGKVDFLDRSGKQLSSEDL